MGDYMEKPKLSYVANAEQQKTTQVSSLQAIDNNLHPKPISNATPTRRDIANIMLRWAIRKDKVNRTTAG